MGDPRRLKKKYKGPSHPWQSDRIDQERVIKKEYGLKNKREIWKAGSELKRLNTQAKKLIREKGKGNPQAKVEEKQLLNKLYKYGLLNEGAQLEDALNLEMKDVLNRRLQTLVFKQGFSLTSKQARQFIVHGDIFVNEMKISVPSYLVSRDEEFKINFDPSSSLASEEHPERIKKAQTKEAADKKRKAEEAAKDAEKALDELTEKELEKVEKEIGEVIV